MPRLDHLLALNLACSRKEAERLLASGDVTRSDGSPFESPRAEIGAPELPLAVAIEGAPAALHESFHLMLHKPVGCITALRDSRHPVAYDLLQDAPLFPQLRAVGRLDLDTSGLIIWTTEGTLVQRLTHPKRKVPRTYQAALARPFGGEPESIVLEDGHRPDIVELRTIGTDALHPALARPPEAATYATITIVGGAYHEVRRIFAALGSHVLALTRTAFGKLALPADLPAGQWRQIQPEDIQTS